MTLMCIPKEKDDTINFESLDYLFVDEADEFKNLSLYTKMTNVSGIYNAGAQKSEDMAAKCDYLNQKIRIPQYSICHWYTDFQ